MVYPAPTRASLHESLEAVMTKKQCELLRSAIEHTPGDGARVAGSAAFSAARVLEKRGFIRLVILSKHGRAYATDSGRSAIEAPWI